MLPNKLILCDADILAYECSFAGQMKDKETGELIILPFDYVADDLLKKVRSMMDTLDTLFEPIMFLSGKENFRNDIAKLKGYKANRDETHKPFHLENCRAYITGRFSTYTSVGCEADDLLCIAQMESLRETGATPELARTVIATRDKDLRQCMGWHYGWEVGNQPEYKLSWVDSLGTLTPIYSKKVLKNGEPSKAIDKLSGTGMKWFYAQLLIGDITDNIPGLPKCGKAKAYELINRCESEDEMYALCKEAYQEVYGDTWDKEMLEQAQLVWMIRERNKDGSLKHWELLDGSRKDS